MTEIIKSIKKICVVTRFLLWPIDCREFPLSYCKNTQSQYLWVFNLHGMHVINRHWNIIQIYFLFCQENEKNAWKNKQAKTEQNAYVINKYLLAEDRALPFKSNERWLKNN